MVRIRITADDYGLDPGVNAGIEALAAAGQVDAVSLMPHAGALLGSWTRLQAPGVTLGAHLVFVEEAPLGQDPELAPLLTGGRFPGSYRSLLGVLAFHPALAEPLAREGALQIDRLLDMGVPVAFVNSHQHVHLFPVLWRALRPVLEARGLEVRAISRILPGPAKQVLVDAVSSISLKAWPLDRCRGVRPVGIESAGRMTAEAAARAARRARPALARGEQVELVVHPGFGSAALKAGYPHWGYQWQTEWDQLASGEIRRAMNEALSE